MGLGLLFRSGGWVEIWRVKLISTQVVVEVEVGVELGKRCWHVNERQLIVLETRLADFLGLQEL